MVRLTIIGLLMACVGGCATGHGARGGTGPSGSAMHDAPRLVDVETRAAVSFADAVERI